MIDRTANPDGDAFGDYPFEGVMFRHEGGTAKIFRKWYGQDEEREIEWSNRLLHNMLFYGGQEPLAPEQYWQGKAKLDKPLTADGRAGRRQLWPLHQVLYLSSALTIEACAAALDLPVQFRSQVPEPDWVTSETEPGTSIQTAQLDRAHEALGDDLTPNIEVWWADHQEPAVDDPATYQLQAELVLKAIGHPDIAAGLYIANSRRTIFWDGDGITVTTDADALTSPGGRAVTDALQTSNIAHSSQPL